MNRKIRALLVDDEPHARKGLHTLLSNIPDIEIAGEAVDGQKAVEAIRNLSPDLVFLDVKMPGLNGLEVIAEIGPDRMPPVIFITAYNEYAVAAFEANAIDYLLKPFSDERFHDALARARELMPLRDDQALAGRLHRLLGQGASPGETLGYFTLQVGDELKVFHVNDIDWIEADDYYTRLHIGGDAHISRQTMGALEAQLPAGRFIRIHRSAIVNLRRVHALEPLFKGDYTVILQDGTRIRMSRRRRAALSDTLKHLS